MKVFHWITGITLLVLLALAIAGLVLTRDLGQPSGNAEGARKPQDGRVATANVGTASQTLVDQSPLQTARRLAALAATPEEKNLSHQALKLADHELDLAFYGAERNAGANLPPLTPQTKELAARKAAAEVAVKMDEDSVAELTRKSATSLESQKENVQDQLEVAKGQLELDQYEVDDAAEDLASAGADPGARIRQLKAEHDASDKEPESAPSPAAISAEQNYQAHTLLHVFRAWRELHSKHLQIAAARQEAAAEVRKLNQQHETFEKRSDAEKSERESVKQQAKGFARGNQNTSREESKATAKATLSSLKQHSQDQKNLAEFDKRIQDEQELGDIYGNWLVFVQARERAALHSTIETMLWIVMILLAMYLASRVIDRVFAGFAAENKRLGTIQAVVKFAVQALGGIAIVFVIFGMPSQTTTILGLAGAGLTVALKDFIVAFFGWFVLMGRNGIRVGDWVEINGVSGEVVEVGLLRTVLLETGNWTDSGHPTGRRVAFVNGFAIEGHFFNFSTSGQWMWDELQVEIPAAQDPYPIIDGIQKLVEKETAANSKIAQQEWQHTTTRYKVQALSAVPGINVRPTGGGIEVNVRYITRAYERHETRARLYQAVVELMHGQREAVKAVGTAAPVGSAKS
jgi:small-conductance mechanosensitive channel